MPKVLYGISPIGLGHATRSLVIIGELKRRGADVRVFSGGKAADFIRSVGVEVDDVVEDAVPSITGLEMGRVSLWYLRSWLAQRRNVRRVGGLIRSFRPDLVVCDEEFSGVVASEGEGPRRALIADELSLGFARSWLAGKIEARVSRWYAELQRSVDLLVIPEAGRDEGNRRYVGPIVRPVTMGCAQVRGRYDVPKGGMVLLSMSGSGVGRALGERLVAALRDEGLSDVHLVVTGNRGPPLGPGALDLGVVQDNQDLVACADLVVTTAGKSTIDEAAAAGTPIIAIPIRYHAEQVRNAGALGYSYEDIDRLPELVRDRLGKRSPPMRFDGHLKAADAIMELAPG